jgi:hypothetical protein
MEPRIEWSLVVSHVHTSKNLSARSCRRAGEIVSVSAHYPVLFMVLLFSFGLSHAQAPPRGYWDDVKEVEGVNSPDHEWRPVISHDGLTLVFSSGRPGGKGNWDLYMATRDSKEEPFGNITNLWDLNTETYDEMGCLSSDGLELFFVTFGWGAKGLTDLFLATREDLNEPFKKFRNIEELNSEEFNAYPWISKDGKWLYFNSISYGPGISVAYREGPGQPFKEVKPIFQTQFGEVAASVSADGSMLFFSDGHDAPIRPGGYGCMDLWMIMLDAPDHTVGQPINLGSPPNGTLCEGYSSLSPDWPAEGATIYFLRAKAIDFSDQYDIYQATWHRFDCDEDGIPDEEEIAAGTAHDIDLDAIPDECEPDCNENSLPDDFDLKNGTSEDCNGNGVPDECEPDCNENGTPDMCEVAPFPSRLAISPPNAEASAFLGPPDGIFVGLGADAVTYDLEPAKVADAPGQDFNVYEDDGGSSDGVEFKAIEVFVSADGITFSSVKSSEKWISVRIAGDEHLKKAFFARSYDLAPSGLPFARYIRIQGTGTGPAGGNNGFDLDAIGLIHYEACIPPAVSFLRGDANADGSTDLSDGIAIIYCLFSGMKKIPCEQAGDTNDDGALEISDGIYILSFLFTGGKAIPPPVGSCGTDLTWHDLPCGSFPACR